MKLLSNITPKLRADLAGLALTSRSSVGNIERYLLRCRSYPIRRNSVLSGFSFSLLVDIHDRTVAKHDCKPFSAAAESPDAKGNIQLIIISIEVVRDSVFKDHAAQWSGIEREKQEIQNGPPKDSKFEIGFGG